MKKVFISYSWKPDNNKKKVLKLAERLTNDGIYVVLDDWDLTEGQDKYTFMERMVNDEGVEKVLLICNKEYSKKADKKQGGVGTESLIVSKQIYKQVDQTKFVPIVMEYENGEACLPTFIGSRIYIDLSSEESFEENYDGLLRNIYSKPISKRPPIGKIPVYLEDEDSPYLPTVHKLGPIKNSLLKGGRNSEILIKDYLDSFVESLHLFKLNIKDDEIDDKNFIEKVEKSIEQMLPLKTNFIDFLQVISKYSSSEFGDMFLDFFEKILQFYEDNEIRLETGNGLSSLINDNYRYFNYDFFLNFVSTLLRFEKIDSTELYQ